MRAMTSFGFSQKHFLQRMEEEEQIRQTVLQSTLEEVNATGNDANGHEDPCVICLDSISERAVARPCHHDSFDFLCLISWLQERSTCPLCKTEVRTVEYDRRSLEDFKVYNVPSSALNTSTSEITHQTRPENARFDFRGRPRPSWRDRRPRHQPPVSPNAALFHRRHVYRNQLYSLHVGSNRLSRFRDLTPQIFCRDEELVSRARKWIRRELQVFDFLNPDCGESGGVSRGANNAEFLLEYIIAILKTVDVKGSGGQAEDMLQEFIGRDNTRLFLHEMKAWLRSPYISLEDWDRHVQYGEAAITIAERGAQNSADRDRNRGTRDEQGRKKHTSSASTTREGYHRGLDRYVPYYARRPNSSSDQYLTDRAGGRQQS